MNNRKKIRKILIPNRGEIAIRIKRTCRELDIPTVAVFSQDDRHAHHVHYADEAYLLPGETLEETYLNREAVFEIAAKCGADAIHPGYGFLSENADFARGCRERGLTFIGPSAESIALMGAKTRSRELMLKNGIPVVPGSGLLQDAEQAVNKAEEIGYPVVVKADAGGGGKGMRVVEDPGRLKAAIEACRREARAAFGDPGVYMEKYLRPVRHIEFEVLGDTFGNIIHLNERECSVQRRHQKIIEETPSTALDENLRARMAETAVAVARAAGYVNSGTVEFLLDENKQFYFLEMITRLQVEHGITEMVTGIDLVERQIRIAEGAKLEMKPYSPHGAAMECRIYAEDPVNDFLPSPGFIQTMRNPGGPGVRNDSGVYAGYRVSTKYDPLMLKLSVRGESRQLVLTRMLRALDESHLLGVRTNINFLRKIVMHPDFVSGKYDTGIVADNLDQLLEYETAAEGEDTIALITSAIIAHMNNRRQESNLKNNGTAGSLWKNSGRMP
ncbi:MAG: ATP-grasp domain-containing protein [bacterium]|nr:ATP-grasp domain-containing protein [bacterium]